MSKERKLSITKDAERFVELWNDDKTYPTLNDVAAELGVSYMDLRSFSKRYREKWAADKKKHVKLINRARKHYTANPLSEDESKYRSDWSQEDCINELRRIAEENPDKHITRNYFRTHSRISESTWNRYFGTFNEFKGAAGIKLNRHIHKLEKDIARHSSVDHYRKLNAERSAWGDKFIKRNDDRFKTALVMSDVHDIMADRFYLRVMFDVNRRAKPEAIVINGDFFDLAEFGQYNIDPREWDVLGRIEFALHIIERLRSDNPDAEIYLIEGNHEYRLLRHICNASPALKVILSDLHNMDIRKLLALDQFEVNYVAKADLSSFNQADIKKEIAKNFLDLWGCYKFHHFPWAKKLAMPGFNGHHHKHIVWSMYNSMYKAYEWHQLGAGHMRRASYTNSDDGWNNGFALAHCDTQTKSTAVDYISVGDEICIAGGQWYYREESERIFAP